MTFDDLLKDALTIPGAMNQEELAYLYELAMKVPNGGTIVEIGCDFGRSTSILAAVAKDRDLEFITVDNFSYSAEPAQAKFTENMNRLNREVTLTVGDSRDIGMKYNNPINLLWINGAHSALGVAMDIVVWSRNIVDGGIIAFHDYGNSSFRGYTEAIDLLMDGYCSLEQRRTVKAYKWDTEVITWK